MIYRRLDSWLFGSSEAGVGERAAIGDCGQVTLDVKSRVLWRLV